MKRQFVEQDHYISTVTVRHQSIRMSVAEIFIKIMKKVINMYECFGGRCINNQIIFNMIDLSSEVTSTFDELME